MGRLDFQAHPQVRVSICKKGRSSTKLMGVGAIASHKGSILISLKIKINKTLRNLLDGVGTTALHKGDDPESFQ